NEIFHPIAVRLQEKCDAVLRVGGASAGADEMVRGGGDLGLKIYRGVEEIPRVGWMECALNGFLFWQGGGALLERDGVFVVDWNSELLRILSNMRRGPDDEVGDAGDGEKDGGDQKEEAKPREFFLFGGIACDFEEEEQESGGDEEHKPNGNA